MKIAIFHNLEEGGALSLTKNTIKFLQLLGNKIDVYSLNQNLKKFSYIDHHYYFPLHKTKNIFGHIKQILFELESTQIEMANIINEKNYDLVIIYPCILTQSPYIIKYIHSFYIYVFTEPKREFYEQTSFCPSVRRFFTQLIRYPIKIVDQHNCKQAKTIITISWYCAYFLKKKFKKESTVIHPGLEYIKPTVNKILNKNNFISVGQLSKLKGHEFTAKQFANASNTISLLGRKTNETDKIVSALKSCRTKYRIYSNVKEAEKNYLLKKHTFFIANYHNEPFGLSTLEAISNKLYVFGVNEGGTPEITSHGLSGTLYPRNHTNSKTSIEYMQLQPNKEITSIQTCKLNWRYYCVNLLHYYHLLKNEPSR